MSISESGFPIDAQLLFQLRDFETPLLANTVGYLDSTPPHRWYLSGDIQSVTPGIGPVAGVAVTCRLDSSSPSTTTADIDPFWRQLEEMQAKRMPTIWVVQCVGSRPRHECVIGEGMAKLLAAAGCAGLVTDGGVRDVRGLLATPFPAWCNGVVVHHGPMRFTGCGEPVEVGGVTIRPGDVIHADNEGVVVLPPKCLPRLADAAGRMRAAEQAVHVQWRRTDLSIAQKRVLVTQLFEKYGFGPSAAQVEPK